MPSSFCATLPAAELGPLSRFQLMNPPSLSQVVPGDPGWGRSGAVPSRVSPRHSSDPAITDGSAGLQPQPALKRPHKVTWL